jgi:hypothetical protein
VTSCGLSSALSQKAAISCFSVLSPKRPDGLDSPVIGLPVRDEGSDAHDRVVDVLGELVADRLADLDVGLADKIVGSREPGEVGHSLQVPDDN